MKITYTTVGENIKALMELKGLNQKQLAVMSKVSQNCISRYISGLRGLDVETAGRIAEALECTINDLLYGKSELVYKVEKSDYAIGYEKGKAEVLKMKEDADGCVGCTFETFEPWFEPCAKCKRNSKDFWRPKIKISGDRKKVDFDV